MDNEPDNSYGACAALRGWPSHTVTSDAAFAVAPPLEAFARPSLPGLDVGALRRVSRTVASERVPAKRIEKLLDAAIDSTRATGGFIALLREDGWEAAVSREISRSSNRSHRQAPRKRLPVSILTVAVRLRNGLTLQDAYGSKHWHTDVYVRRFKPRSLTCLPIRFDGTLTGALYLEHRELPGAFTSAHIALLEIIALQAGFALDNARLHEALDLQQAHMRETLSALDRASRLKSYGELAASIVHEVAQPVSALDTSARAGLKWLNRSTPNIDAAREMLAHICACAMRARTIIGALRARARQAAPEFVALDLAEVLREAAEIVACTLDAMNVDLRLRGLSGSFPVSGERIQLQQAVIGLLMNAAESMHAIPESERMLVLSCDRGEEHVCIHIDDNGHGVDPLLAQRIFEPLFTTKPHGMGMGLAICKSIVQAHRGQLELTPRREGGTRATIVLPLAAP
ncbi:sensor histidine kinase [Trinickia diaoshuihuensis]|uniref:sensor histidine kinase n=1 Tax=Trinickia diaoshuihuensis TaxID=2292265 RepID=UPI000E28514E|nr:ATP-binding protein [Trinickia diaoshuihuensis]